MTIISAEAIRKTYQRGTEQIHAVDSVDLSIEQGDFLSIVGASGSGKTSLLHILGCLDNPSGGRLQVDNQEVFANSKAMPEKKLTGLRSRIFGYIFQSFYLIPTLTVKENILLPYAFKTQKPDPNAIHKVAKQMGLEHRLSHLPGELSGGEMQRVAIARAIVTDPKVILADEPTGNLDSRRSAEIAEILYSLNQDYGKTIVLVTHNPEIAARARRVIELKDGKIV